MKILINKIICCYLILLLLLVGCSNKGDEENEFISATINPDEVILIELYNSNFYGPSPSAYEDERETFCEILKKQFGLDLIVRGVGVDERTLETLFEFGGLVLVGESGVRSWAETGIMYPITDLLKDNETWESLPWYFRDNGMINGEIWAIPARSLTTMLFEARFIRQDWLNQVDLKKPETIDEYYECMKAFVYNDPNQNNIDDTIGFTSIGLRGLVDIFNSYGCRLSPSRIYKLAWDPISEKYVDGLRSENIKDCLGFLNSCYSEGLLDNSFKSITQFNILEKYYSGKIGSLNHFVTFHDDIETRMNIDHNIITGLRGKVKERLVPVLYECSKFYMLTESTENKEAVVNKFVDVFLGNDVGYFMGVYGTPTIGNETGDFLIDGNKIYLNFEMNNNRIANRQYPNILSGHPVYSKYESIYINAEDNTSVYNRMSDYDRNIAQSIISDNEDSFYIVNEKYKYSFDMDYYHDTDINERDIANLGTEIIFNSIMGKVSITDALDEYKSMVEAMGLDRVLDHVNLDIANGVY